LKFGGERRGKERGSISLIGCFRNEVGGRGINIFFIFLDVLEEEMGGEWSYKLTIIAFIFQF
jgi:hypothetical protein